MQNFDYAVLYFSSKHGCRHYTDIQDIFGVTDQVKQTGMQVIEKEINKKMHKIRISPIYLILLFGGILVIVLSLIFQDKIGPFAIFMFLLGLALMVSYCIIGTVKSNNLSSFLNNASTQMTKETAGELQLVPVWNHSIYYGGRRTRRRHTSSRHSRRYSFCQHILVKSRDSFMTPEMVLSNTNPYVQQHLIEMQIQQHNQHARLASLINHQNQQNNNNNQNNNNSQNQNANNNFEPVYNPSQGNTHNYNNLNTNQVSPHQNPYRDTQTQKLKNKDETASFSELRESQQRNIPTNRLSSANDYRIRPNDQNLLQRAQNIPPELRPHSVNMQMEQFRNMIPQQYRNSNNNQNRDPPPPIDPSKGI